MSYVLLCKGNKALKPYYIEDIRKKIYTLEELCYYLYHNTVLCAEELVRFQLAHWIGHQLGFQDLSESLLRILEKEKRPEKIASQIFAYADYLTKQEREAVCEKIRRNSELSWNERKKMRADYYVLEKHYQDAIREYEDILLQKEYNTAKEKHHIIYDIGCCYAHMFYFDLAYDCFIRACDMEISQKEDLRAALFCKRMLLSDREYEDFLADHEEFIETDRELSEQIRGVKHEFSNEVQTKEPISGKVSGNRKERVQYISDKLAEYKLES